MPSSPVRCGQVVSSLHRHRWRFRGDLHGAPEHFDAIAVPEPWRAFGRTAAARHQALHQAPDVTPQPKFSK